MHRLAGASDAAAAPRAGVMLQDEKHRQITQLQPHGSQRSYVEGNDAFASARQRRLDHVCFENKMRRTRVIVSPQWTSQEIACLRANGTVESTSYLCVDSVQIRTATTPHKECREKLS